MLGGVGKLLSERVSHREGSGRPPHLADAEAWKERAIEAIEAALGPGPHPLPQPEAAPAERVPPEPMSDETRNTLILVLWLVALSVLALLRFA